MSVLRRVIPAIGLLASLAVAVFASAGSVLADGPGDAVPVTMSFEEPRASGEEGALSISVQLTDADGEPVTREPVEFFVTPEFMEERPVALGTVLTNAKGRATIAYTPTWEGEHPITARFAGSEAYQPVEATSVLNISGVPSSYTSPATPLSPLRQWATPGAIAVVLAVWLTMALVVGRVGWGIWRANRGSEVTASPSPEATAEGAPGGNLGH